MISGSFKKCYLQTICLQIMYTYRQDLALNNLPGLACHKTQSVINFLTDVILYEVPVSVAVIHCYISKELQLLV